MSEYGQKLREFVIGCPSGAPIAQKLMSKLNEAAEKFDTLQMSHDDLLRSDEERKSYAITIRKTWAALGIMDYKAADGKSIDELVLLIKQQRDALLAAIRVIKITANMSLYIQDNGVKRIKILHEIGNITEQAIAEASK